VSFLNDSLKSFFEYSSDHRVSQQLKARVAKLKEMLKKEYEFTQDSKGIERLMK